MGLAALGWLTSLTAGGVVPAAGELGELELAPLGGSWKIKRSRGISSWSVKAKLFVSSNKSNN